MMIETAAVNDPAPGADAEENFYRYYAERSVARVTLQRFRSIYRAVLQTRRRYSLSETQLDMADIGCNAGTQAVMWAQDGHRVHGLDINEQLVALAKERATEAKLTIDYRVGSATGLPWETQSMDVCLAPELLEHVPEWELCLDELCRVLRPQGLLYLSTNNVLCPRQEEFNLPLYSWYPAPLKRHYERLALSSRPELANHAKFPAVNWFTFYSLKKELAKRGLVSLDRFAVIDAAQKGWLAKFALKALDALPPLRFAAHVASPYTLIIAIKQGEKAA